MSLDRDGFGAAVEHADDGRPVLVVHESQTVKVRFLGTGDHDATLAGLRRLVDGIWRYQQAVAALRYEERRAADDGRRRGTP
ncbi:hypothetical protein ACNTMW_07670 [Planosporangium sp. 12N6]|uniref:hypothetical protein n=1 Tax=Planosporangium spinosum TaxID=3402278 RepID=UPI003CEEA2FD